jgi:hypothetical protein
VHKEKSHHEKRREESLKTGQALGFLYENFSPRDPNYQEVRRFYRGFLVLVLELNADAYGGQWPIPNFENRLVDLVANYLFFVIKLKDSSPDSAKLQQLNRIGKKLAKVIEAKLKARAKRMGGQGVADMIMSIRWKICQIVEIAKAEMLRIADKRERQRQDTQAEAAKERQKWKAKMRPGWSILQWQTAMLADKNHRAIAYETLKKYFDGVTTNRTNSIRADLAKFTGVALTEVPA